MGQGGFVLFGGVKDVEERFSLILLNNQLS